MLQVAIERDYGAPRAASNPARYRRLLAEVTPKRINRTAKFRARKPRTCSAVPSLEPSSTKIISQTSAPGRDKRIASKTARTFFFLIIGRNHYTDRGLVLLLPDRRNSWLLNEVNRGLSTHSTFDSDQDEVGGQSPLCKST